jgi:peroxiredoxin
VRVLAAVVLASALAGCGADRDEPEQAARSTAPAIEARPAPDISGRTLEGKPLGLDDYRGKPVFVVVWSSWWLVCNGEAVAFAQFAEDHPEFEYLGLDVADTPDRGREFVSKYEWTWPSIVDPARERAKRLGADWQPAVFVVDEQGRVVAEHLGAGDAATWEALAEAL